jgi:hypothetical protein
MKPAAVDLHIEELVLHGFEPRDRYSIGDAVERELTRLFAEQLMPPSLAATVERPHVDAGDVRVAPDSKPQHVGAQVANAIFGGLAR